jgi:hypothetical protein
MADLVALQTMLPKIDSPYDQQGKALQLRQMMNAGQQADFEAQQRQQAAADDQSYRAAMQANPTGGAGLLSALAGSGNYKGYAAAQKADLDQRKGNADVAHLGAQTQQASMTALNQAFTLHRDQINTVNDPQSAAAWVAAAYKDPTLGPLVSQAGPVEDAIKRIPTDPAGFAKWKTQAGTNADEYVKRTTVSADTAANNATSVKTAGISAAASKYSADTSARTAGNRLAFDKDQAAAEDAPDTTTQKEKELWLHTYTANNGQMPRSAPPSVRKYIGTWAAEMGITPDDLSSGAAKAKFDQAMAVTAGHRGGAMASVENTIPALLDNAMDLSHKLGQGKFVPLNQLVQMADSKISDPQLAAFKVAHMAVVSEYQQVISRGGTNVTALKEAMHVLNSATSPEAYDSALNQVKKEVEINVAGTQKVRAGLGAGGHGAAPTAAPIAAGWTVKEH